MGRLLYWFLLVFAILFTSCNQNPSAGGTSVQGNGIEFSVVDSNGEPVSEVTLRIRERDYLQSVNYSGFILDTVVSNQSSLVLDKMPIGQYILEIAYGDQGAILDFTVNDEDSVIKLGSIALQLLGTVQGLFIFPETVDPSNYSVLIPGLEAKEVLSEAGDFLLRLPAGVYPLELWSVHKGSLESLVYKDTITIGANSLTDLGEVFIPTLQAGLLNTWNVLGKDSAYLHTDSSEYNFGTSDFSVCAWFKTDALLSSSISERLVTKEADAQGHWSLSIHSQGIVTFRVRENDANADRIDAAGGNSLLNNQWHHLVGVRAHDSIYLYIDGVFEASQFTGRISIDSDIPLGIGRSGINESHAFNGEMGEVRIYDRPLHVEEIKMLANFSPVP
jgi:hypothetical protein